MVPFPPRRAGVNESLEAAWVGWPVHGHIAGGWQDQVGIDTRSLGLYSTFFLAPSVLLK